MTVCYIPSMGIQDRDWYRDWWKNKENHVEKTRFRLPAKSHSNARNPAQWHPVLTALATVFICGAIYLVFLLIAHFFHIKR